MSCGEGIQIRTVVCYNVSDNVPVNESFCLQNISMPKPKTQNSCMGTSCMGKWGYDDWGKVCKDIPFMHDMIQHHHLYCSVKHNIVMRKDIGTETFIVTMEID